MDCPPRARGEEEEGDGLDAPPPRAISFQPSPPPSQAKKGWTFFFTVDFLPRLCDPGLAVPNVESIPVPSLSPLHSCSHRGATIINRRRRKSCQSFPCSFSSFLRTSLFPPSPFGTSWTAMHEAKSGSQLSDYHLRGWRLSRNFSVLYFYPETTLPAQAPSSCYDAVQRRFVETFAA